MSNLRSLYRPAWHALVVALALAAVANCGGGSNGSPNGPGGTVTSITINLRDIVRAGVSVVATATSNLSNGQTQAVTNGWRSDAPTVATITDAGNLTPLANGEVTITVTSGSAQASKRIRVTPNYDGIWQGMQVITACTATGEFSGLCDEGGSIIGASFPVRLTMRHPNDLAVSGESFIEELPFPTFATQIESDGGIRFSSSMTVEGFLAEASWELNSAEVGRATGSIRERYSAPGLATGDISYTSNLGGFMRTSADADPPQGSSRLTRLRNRVAVRR